MQLKKISAYGILFILCILLLISASEVSAQARDIDKLNFIYKTGFKIHFSGERINYDYYNFPKSKESSFLEYNVVGDKQKGKENVLGFRSSQDNGKDTVTYDNFVSFNDDGMYFWIWDNEKKIKQKNKTQAISLPLRPGKTWDSYYDKYNAKMECISTDSLIKTPIGEFKTFVVKTTFTDKSQKDFDKEVTLIDFYNTDLGQVEMQVSSTAIIKTKDDTIRKKLSALTLLADKLTKPE